MIVQLENKPLSSISYYLSTNKTYGLTYISKKLMKSQPLLEVMILGNSPKSSLNAVKTLGYGAVEIIEKPNLSSPENLEIVLCCKSIVSSKHHFK